MKRVKPEDWYTTEKVGDDITLIGEPHIKEFFRCNVWHVRGRDRDMLVDSGMGVVSLRAHVPLVTEKKCTAVASHTHFDHIGCHHEFGTCLVHEAELDILRNPGAAATLADLYVSDDIFTALPPLPYHSTEYSITGVADPTPVVDGDVIDLGDRTFEVIHTPGHSPGGIALWEAASGILFSGDIVYDGPLIEDTYHANAQDYLRSMRRLLEYPVRVVHGGHFPSYDGRRHRELIETWLRDRDA